ncbi:RalBP1-associated Eps domain-containing protein 1 [Lamellibrachia satsuma]|nr:RalBP1-associated Eps domain-containing protein 1 [Lamellibrachia satsuma]
MEPVILNEQEQRIYADLFCRCDAGNSGKVTGIKATELFVCSGLPPETLHQITEQCGAKRLGHFGRSQFYIALKLIAAAQNGHAPVLESLSSGKEIPLLRLAKPLDADSKRGQLSHTSFNQHITEQETGNRSSRTSGQLTPSATRQHSFPGSPVIPGYDSTHTLPTQCNTGGEMTTAAVKLHDQNSSSAFCPTQRVSPQLPSEPVIKQVVPPVVTATGDAQPNASNNVDKAWASFEDIQGLLSQEVKEWAHFTDSTKGDTSSLSSEAESIDDIWSINDEQREYYTNQFRTMQTDLTGVISGAVSKEFFEKSRLPVQELSKIWQLSDVNKDGALSLDEFCTAMHLVVLRRNNIELPEHLPTSLMPYAPLTNPEEPFAADLPPGSTLKRISPSSPAQWTTTFPLPESPTSSSVSSPGTKPTPVNFEFRPITADSDSKIVHPVALRMSPDGQAVPVDGAPDRSRTFSDGTAPHENSQDPHSPPFESMTSPSKEAEVDTDVLIDLSPEPQQTAPLPIPLQARPRPTPKKSQSVPGPNHDNLGQPRLLPPPSSQDHSSSERPNSLVVAGGTTNVDSAPCLPPRGKTGHSRSSSLDNHLGQSFFIPPPAVPPRPSPKEAGSDQMSTSLYSPSEEKEFVLTTATKNAEEPQKLVASMPTVAPLVTSVRSGSFSEDVMLDEAKKERTKSLTRQTSSEMSSLQKSNLETLVRQQKERNMLLSRLNSELNQELQEVMEQRIALEIQLDHLRPFSN